MQLMFKLKNPLGKIKRFVLNWDSIRISRLIKKLENLPDFPSSSSSNRQFLELTLLGARQTYSHLAELNKKNKIEVVELSDYLPGVLDSNLSTRLSNLFKEHGSDKSGTHNYYLLYAKLLESSAEREFQLLEIGIGSNNRKVPSNMGIMGVPGASLRSFRDLNENVIVTGADIDEEILFSENRISTLHLDQTNEISWSEFKERIKDSKFDLIIDDGLHAPIANLSTIKNLLGYLKPGGAIVVEDIHERSFPVWEIFNCLTNDYLHFNLVKTKAAYVAVIRDQGLTTVNRE